MRGQPHPESGRSLVLSNPESGGFPGSAAETRHNLPSPFTIDQGFHPNPALLGNDKTWRPTPDQDEGIA
ncbi:hypothetical protein SBA5_470034 [Candidatus Sulfotelmatomonas gaucii]|uniref:Uncharacterized protein n=1 Tax=Candidatus Sulfuritelmatomonas gaucii TaxID=2043161 RepID=A0A2N9LP93_9BACT|nr:hypothetical protein SBA5_470034 [Candidatus Sulfotelmatomonas gaucii]